LRRRTSKPPAPLQNWASYPSVSRGAMHCGETKQNATPIHRCSLVRRETVLREGRSPSRGKQMLHGLMATRGWVTKSRLCFQLRLSEQAKVLSYGIVLRAYFVADGGFGQSTRASISVPSTRTLQKRRTQIDMRERACRREKATQTNLYACVIST
jgi:hypothetical protein